MRIEKTLRITKLLICSIIDLINWINTKTYFLLLYFLCFSLLIYFVLTKRYIYIYSDITDN